MPSDVTVGVAKVDFVKRMEAEPLHTFTLKVVGVATYQLGKYGVAAKKLWESRASVGGGEGPQQLQRRKR